MSRHGRGTLRGLLVLPALVSLALFGPAWTTFAPDGPGAAADGPAEVMSGSSSGVGFDETVVSPTLGPSHQRQHQAKAASVVTAATMTALAALVAVLVLRSVDAQQPKVRPSRPRGFVALRAPPAIRVS